MTRTDDDGHYARLFIRWQLGVYALAGITTMTVKQRERIERQDVVLPYRKIEAKLILDTMSKYYGRPPYERTGLMRVVNMNTGTIEERRA